MSIIGRPRQVLPLFGPVFRFELVRTARRGRCVLHRCVYAGVLLLMVFLAYSSWFPEGLKSAAWFREMTVEATQLARFAESVTTAFLTAQFLVVVLVAPAYAAGAIGEEKQRRTLEFLMATDLSSREIVLGKLAARVGNLFLLLLTGLPVLGFLQFLGGVDPELLLAATAATAATALSITSLSVLVSIYKPNAFDATFYTYQYILFGFTFTLIGMCVPCGNLGNPFVALFEIDPAATPAGARSSTVAGALANYVGCHLLVALVCAVWATRRLRQVALSEPTPAPREKAAPVPPDLPVANAVGTRNHLLIPDDQPMLWKELYREQHKQHNQLQSCLALPLIAYLMALVFLTCSGATGNLAPADANVLPRVLGTALACGALAIVAINAAGRVSREREQRTLDSLRTTALGWEEILYAKWRASLLGLHLLWWMVGGIWFLGLVSGGLHFLAFPLLLGAWAVYAVFAASLGLWFSTVSRGTTQATVRSLLTLFVLCTVPPLVSAFLAAVASGTPLGPAVATLDRWLVHALNPPAALWTLTCYYGESQRPDGFATAETLTAAILGLPVYLAAAHRLWRASGDALTETG